MDCRMRARFPLTGGEGEDAANDVVVDCVTEGFVQASAESRVRKPIDVFRQRLRAFS
jgi:hypothetical protein